MPKNDVKTSAIVLRRTKYGEADRIINLITPQGKLSVIAKGVRKEKSKLAGGIEMFCVSEITAHYKSGATNNLGILTSTKLQTFYSGILSDLNRLELASNILKQVSKLSENIDSPELYQLAKSCFSALNNEQNLALIESWSLFNLARISGEQINLRYDISGQNLKAEEKYTWDSTEQALAPHAQGKITADHIKLMRLMLSSDLNTTTRVKSAPDLMEDILYIAKSCYN